MRRAQLVAPFGVGAMSILVNGTSVVTAGLDQWFQSENLANLVPSEYSSAAADWRLQERLNVAELRLSPDYRRPVPGQSQQNVGLTIPVLRFPRWSVCMYCKRLQWSPLSLAQLERCVDEKHGAHKLKPVMTQVPFVITCERGHLDDFPFREWVHRSLNPACQGVLRLKSLGGGSLAGQSVECDDCPAKRSLINILDSSDDEDGAGSTFLTEHLAKEGTFDCKGSRPWLNDPGSGCGHPVRGALRGAGNVYFPKVESSIFLPQSRIGAKAEVLEILRRADVQPTLQLLMDVFGSLTVAMLRQRIPAELMGPFTDEELEIGIQELYGGDGDSAPSVAAGDLEELSGSASWRLPEYQMLRETPNHDDLKTTNPGLPSGYEEAFGRIRRVDVVRETRALRGFTRVKDGPLRLSEGKELLRRSPLPPSQDWLPAYVVRGEGIFFEFDRDRLEAWESRSEVSSRVSLLQGHADAMHKKRGQENSQVLPRLVLIHTFAHVVINQLIYSCGYSSASLRERLYVSNSADNPMSGVLIYTAAGDSEGTMGGLVRMAQADNLGSIMTAALENAGWCSADPICMEMGKTGQGPDSCNLAACHGCSLLPETSCEEFNRFLDRGLLVGAFGNPSLGYFTAK